VLISRTGKVEEVLAGSKFKNSIVRLRSD